MKRAPLLRKTRLVAKKPLKRTSSLVSTTRLKASQLLTRGNSLKRTVMKRKPRRARAGDDPKYKAWIRSFPCVVPGLRPCKRADPHHIIDGRGEQRKGMGQTAADKDCFPLCRAHHEDLHHGTGFCKFWTKEKRRIFQEQEIERFNEMWRDFVELGVLQEPLRKAI